MKYFALVLCAVFVFFALVQFNDPDPFIWVPIYLFSSYTSFCSYKTYYNPMLLSLLCLGYFIGAIALFPPSVSNWIFVEEKAKSLKMNMPFIEEARESMGLIICFLVNLVFLLIGLKKAKLPDYNLGMFQMNDPNLK
jgi:hypothetical protein